MQVSNSSQPNKLKVNSGSGSGGNAPSAPSAPSGGSTPSALSANTDTFVSSQQDQGRAQGNLEGGLGKGGIGKYKHDPDQGI